MCALPLLQAPNSRLDGGISVPQLKAGMKHAFPAEPSLPAALKRPETYKRCRRLRQRDRLFDASRREHAAWRAHAHLPRPGPALGGRPRRAGVRGAARICGRGALLRRCSRAARSTRRTCPHCVCSMCRRCTPQSSSAARLRLLTTWRRSSPASLESLDEPPSSLPSSSRPTARGQGTGWSAMPTALPGRRKTAGERPSGCGRAGCLS